MTSRSVVRMVGSLTGIAGVAFSITLLSRSMRAVQAIGGTCASGNTTFVPTHPCPKGIAGTFPLAIFAGLAFLALFFLCAGPRGRPVALLAWPALFLTLGWNFLDYGLNPTTGGSSVSVGFLVCAVVFILMGGVPLIFLVPSLFNALVGTESSSGSSTGASPLPIGVSTVQFTPTTPAAATFPSSIPTPSTSSPASPSSVWAGVSTGGADVAGTLERLASLHRRGELTDAEYEAAKRRALDGSGTSA